MTVCKNEQFIFKLNVNNCGFIKANVKIWKNLEKLNSELTAAKFRTPTTSPILSATESNLSEFLRSHEAQMENTRMADNNISTPNAYKNQTLKNYFPFIIFFYDSGILKLFYLSRKINTIFIYLTCLLVVVLKNKGSVI